MADVQRAAVNTDPTNVVIAAGSSTELIRTGTASCPQSNSKSLVIGFVQFTTGGTTAGIISSVSKMVGTQGTGVTGAVLEQLYSAAGNTESRVVMGVRSSVNTDGDVFAFFGNCNTAASTSKQEVIAAIQIA